MPSYVIPVDDAGAASTFGWGPRSLDPRPFLYVFTLAAGAAAPIEVQLTGARRTT
jgi:hypothetical protein